MSPQPWQAPASSGPVIATVAVPGSKSMTNRALLLGALGAGTSVLRRPLVSRDTRLMATALRTLGAGITNDSGPAGEDVVLVTPGPSPDGTVAVDVGNAGTVLRFVPPVAVLGRSTVGVDGDEAVRRRPMGPLLSALGALGAQIDDGGRGCAPFVIRGRGGLAGGSVELDASSSSQLVSALLLAGAGFDRGVTARHVGDRPVPNAPHLEMTMSMLRQRGVTVTAEPGRWSVEPGRVAALDCDIEPDLSTAAPFLAAAAVTAGRVTVTGWPTRSTQPGALLPELLSAFGAQVEHGGDGLTLTGPGRLHGADLDLRDAGELTPVLAAVAVTADSPTRLRGISYLRFHETDRLAALAAELSRTGARVEETGDGLRITPGALRGTGFTTFDDHRMAMAGAVVGLVVPGVVLDDVETTAKTFPGFAAAWSGMLGTDLVGATR